MWAKTWKAPPTNKAVSQSQKSLYFPSRNYSNTTHSSVKNALQYLLVVHQFTYCNSSNYLNCSASTPVFPFTSDSTPRDPERSPRDSKVKDSAQVHLASSWPLPSKLHLRACYDHNTFVVPCLCLHWCRAIIIHFLVHLLVYVYFSIYLDLDFYWIVLCFSAIVVYEVGYWRTFSKKGRVSDEEFLFEVST